jgi:hypothetical protein
VDKRSSGVRQDPASIHGQGCWGLILSAQTLRCPLALLNFEAMACPIADGSITSYESLCDRQVFPRSFSGSTGVDVVLFLHTAQST